MRFTMSATVPGCHTEELRGRCPSALRVAAICCREAPAGPSGGSLGPATVCLTGLVKAWRRGLPSVARPHRVAPLAEVPQPPKQECVRPADTGRTLWTSLLGRPIQVGTLALRSLAWCIRSEPRQAWSGRATSMLRGGLEDPARAPGRSASPMSTPAVMTTARNLRSGLCSIGLLTARGISTERRSPIPRRD